MWPDRQLVLPSGDQTLEAKLINEWALVSLGWIAAAAAPVWHSATTLAPPPPQWTGRPSTRWAAEGLWARRGARWPSFEELCSAFPLNHALYSLLEVIPALYANSKHYLNG